mmetsp:Transcript_8609/g.14852  ORF Transcript_8609/g.14852 Transcript_8609/m.14852 type:complete len:102 (+) Transcript_8609:399-704(+)
MGNILSSQEESYQLRMKIDALEREERAKQARIGSLEKEKIDVEKEERAKQARIEYLEKEKIDVEKEERAKQARIEYLEKEMWRRKSGRSKPGLSTWRRRYR